MTLFSVILKNISSRRKQTYSLKQGCNYSSTCCFRWQGGLARDKFRRHPPIPSSFSSQHHPSSSVVWSKRKLMGQGVCQELSVSASEIHRLRMTYVRGQLAVLVTVQHLSRIVMTSVSAKLGEKWHHFNISPTEQEVQPNYFSIAINWQGEAASLLILDETAECYTSNEERMHARRLS